MDNNLKLLPCPFCGHKLDINDEDTVYPTGSIWRQEPEGYRTYHSERGVEGQRCIGIHCKIHDGGCGASISGGSLEEAVEKWNASGEFSAAVAQLAELAQALKNHAENFEKRAVYTAQRAGEVSGLYESLQRAIDEVNARIDQRQSLPNCGACPGDGTVCQKECRLESESPKASNPLMAIKQLVRDMTEIAGGRTPINVPIREYALGALAEFSEGCPYLTEAIANSALNVMKAEPVAEVYGTTKSFGSGDDETFHEGTAVRLLKDLPKGTKLYLEAAPRSDLELDYQKWREIGNPRGLTGVVAEDVFKAAIREIEKKNSK